MTDQLCPFVSLDTVLHLLLQSQVYSVNGSITFGKALMPRMNIADM